MECKGFLFDLDGTLVDSLPAVERAWSNWGQRHGIEADEILGFIHGKQAITSLRHFMHGSSEEEIQQEFRLLEKTEAEDTDGVSALPGACELLEQLNAQGIPWAIVTSGSMPVASARQQAAGLPLPAHFVTAERVKNGKPEPDAYLIGAELLGLKPADCIVVEDAPAGILSGLAAGCTVIAVNAPADTPRLEETALRLTTLEALRIEKSAEGTIRVLTQK